MHKLLNVWLPAAFFEEMSKQIFNPVLFAFVKDGKPTLEIRVAGEKPEQFDQFMFIELPKMEKQEEENDSKENRDS